jgi:hypothetical protein
VVGSVGQFIDELLEFLVGGHGGSSGTGNPGGGNPGGGNG